MIKYTHKVREQRLCCVLNRSCFITKHLKPFITRHPHMIAKILQDKFVTSSYQLWKEDILYTPGYVAGYLGSMLLNRK